MPCGAEIETMVIEFKSGKATLRPEGVEVDISASATVVLMRDGTQIVAMLGPDAKRLFSSLGQYRSADCQRQQTLELRRRLLLSSLAVS
jgi:hypothetical protein